MQGLYQLSDYDYALPEARIAQAPHDRRDHSRLLVADRSRKRLQHRHFYDIAALLNPEDVLVVNDTRVVPGRIFGRKETGGKVEVLILDYADAIKNKATTGRFTCKCLVRAAKGPRPGTRLFFDEDVSAEVTAAGNGSYILRFSDGPDMGAYLQRIGRMPLPPYIRRDPAEPDTKDRKTYQTVYAANEGAIAAPTAGLHFTGDLVAALKAKGVTVAPITLHVGYGTFLPVRVDDIREHQMHSESFSVSEDTAGRINQARANGGRVIAVGTTAVRTLEYIGDDAGRIHAGSGHCDLFIYPGYRFKIIDAMITNFHLPKSTLLMLVSAFAGRDFILRAYREAIRAEYRFYSYGDAMFIH